MAPLEDVIRTKLIVELSPGRFFSLGFGDIINSEANVVCVSSFIDEIAQTLDYFSDVGALWGVETSQRPGEVSYDKKIKAGYPYLLDLPKAEYGFRRLLVICKGTRGQPPQAVLGNIQIGLARSISVIGRLEAGLQIDSTAMGVGISGGGIDSKSSFDLLLEWITELFSKCKNVDHVRLVSNVPDTFVDLFESLHKFKSIALSSELSLTATINPESYGEFGKDVAAAIHLSRSNPKQAIVICRTIIESVVRKLCYKHLKKPPTKLYGDIADLRSRNIIPEFIFSYLQTCRVLGNFSNHMDFAPAERDAEAVTLLALRVVEWFLESVP